VTARVSEAYMSGTGWLKWIPICLGFAIVAATTGFVASVLVEQP
jgi:hypothetical protein